MPDRFRIVGEPQGSEGHNPSSSSQWSIWSIIVLTFAAAVIVAGFVRMGFEGAIGMSLMTCLGLYGGQQVLNPKSTGVPRIIGGILIAFSIYGWYFINSVRPRPLVDDIEEVAELLTSPTTWTNLAILCVIAFLFYRLSGPRWDIEIVYDDNRLISHRGLPRAKRNDFESLCQHDPMFRGRVCIRVNRQPNGYLRTSIVGDISEGDRQKIRNTLNALL
ncbi:MAG: hypothetical protein AAF497_14545 [Planctomycetota bacterium]